MNSEQPLILACDSPASSIGLYYPINKDQQLIENWWKDSLNYLGENQRKLDSSDLEIT